MTSRERSIVVANKLDHHRTPLSETDHPKQPVPGLIPKHAPGKAAALAAAGQPPGRVTVDKNSTPADNYTGAAPPPAGSLLKWRAGWVGEASPI